MLFRSSGLHAEEAGRIIPPNAGLVETIGGLRWMMFGLPFDAVKVLGTLVTSNMLRSSATELNWFGLAGGKNIGAHRGP